jgi:hypothetical protein
MGGGGGATCAAAAVGGGAATGDEPVAAAAFGIDGIAPKLVAVAYPRCRAYCFIASLIR